MKLVWKQIKLMMKLEEKTKVGGDSDDERKENVRSEFEKGNLDGKSNLHKQLKFYLTLPEIAKCERNIVKTLLERIRIHSEWEVEKDKNFHRVKNKQGKGREGNLKIKVS